MKNEANQALQPSGPTKNALRAVLERARNAGIARLKRDTTTFKTDDQDCYPRQIHLTIERHRAEWKLLKELERELEWLGVDRRGRALGIAPPTPIAFRLAEFGYKEAVAQSLTDDGIDCYVDVYWR